MSSDAHDINIIQAEEVPDSTSKTQSRPSKLTKLILWAATLGIFALGLGVRLYDLTDEPLDFHSTRQLRSAIIARGMYYDMLPDADPELKKLAISHWFSTGQYEPSFLENIVARTYILIGSEQVWIARIYNSLSWIIGGIALFALARRMMENIPKDNKKVSLSLSWVTALVVLAYYMLNPFGVQASRSFQPDPGMVMWILLSLYTLYRWSEKGDWKWAILTGILAGVAVLTKAVAAYIIGGAAAALVIYTLGIRQPVKSEEISQKNSFLSAVKRIVLNPQVWVMAILMIVPVMIYYLSRGERSAEFFNSWTVSLSHLLLKPDTYARWLRLVESLMGLAVLLLALIGVLIARSKNRALLLGLWIGYLIYGLFLPYQMYTHNYYHLQLIPIIALSLVSIVELVVERLSHQHKIWQALAVGVSIIVIGYTSWLAIFPQYVEDNRHERAYWAEIGELLPSDGKILALTQDYGYRLMYYGWRKVNIWPPRGEIKLAKLRGSEKEFDEYFSKRIEGKNYFLITSFNQFNDQPVLKETLNDRYPIYAEAPGYLIFDLTQPYDSLSP